MVDKIKSAVAAYAAHRGALGLPGKTPRAVGKALASRRLAGAAVLVGDQWTIPDFEAADRAWAANTDTAHYSMQQIEAITAASKPRQPAHPALRLPTPEEAATLKAIEHLGPAPKFSPELWAALEHADAHPDEACLTPAQVAALDQLLDWHTGSAPGTFARRTPESAPLP